MIFYAKKKKKLTRFRFVAKYRKTEKFSKRFFHQSKCSKISLMRITSKCDKLIVMCDLITVYESDKTMKIKRKNENKNIGYHVT